MIYRPQDLWYRIKYFSSRRRIIIKPRYLGYTRCDVRDLLIHANFELLSQFWEKEIPRSLVEWREGDWAPRHNGVLVIETAEHLYNWFHRIYIPWFLGDIEQELFDQMPEPLEYFSHIFPSENDEMLYWGIHEALNELEYQMELEVEQNLKLLMEIRPYLWT